VEENGTSAVAVYPNPVSDILHLEGDIDDGQVSIFDLMGRRVYTGAYQPTIPVDQLNDGMYLLSVTTNEGQVINQKFIIRK
jgi:hypothetical protein